MPIRRCTVDLPILKKKEFLPYLEEQANSTLPSADSWPTMTPRQSARATKGEGWPDQIRKYFTETTLQEDAGEELSVNDEGSLGNHIVEKELEADLLRGAKVLESKVLEALRSQESRIQCLTRDLERERCKTGDLEQEKIKQTEQILKMKSLIQPLRDEVVRQRSIKDSSHVREMASKEEEVATMREEIVAKDRKIEEQTKLITSLGNQVKEVRDEQLEIGEEWEGIVKEKKLLIKEKEHLQADKEATDTKVKQLELKVKEMSDTEFRLKFENTRNLQKLKDMAGKEVAYHKIQKELVDLQTKMMEKESFEIKLREKLEIKNAECEKSSETTRSLKKFEALLAKVKSDCRKVKKENERCREKLEKKRRDISSLKRVIKEKETVLSHSGRETIERLEEDKNGMWRPEEVQSQEGDKKRKLLRETDTPPQSKKAKVVEHISDETEQSLEEGVGEVSESSTNVEGAPSERGGGNVLDSCLANFDEISEEQSLDRADDVRVGFEDSLTSVASTSPFHSPGQPIPSSTSSPPVSQGSPTHILDPSSKEIPSTCSPSANALSQPSLPSTSRSVPASPRPLGCPDSSAELSEDMPALASIPLPDEATPVFKVRNLEDLVRSGEEEPSAPSPEIDPAKIAEVLARLEEINMKKLKHEMKNQVEAALKRYNHTSNPEVYSQKSWEIFDSTDFAAVCRALAVKSREEVSDNWNLLHGSLEGVKLTDEDISRIKGDVDFFFNMRKELSLRLCDILSIEDPAYLTELHEAAALLFSLTPSLNCRPTSPTFDFYINVRKDVAALLGRVSGEDVLRLSLWFCRHLIESHVHFNPGTEPTLSDDNRLFVRNEMKRMISRI